MKVEIVTFNTEGKAASTQSNLILVGWQLKDGVMTIKVRVADEG